MASVSSCAKRMEELSAEMRYRRDSNLDFDAKALRPEPTTLVGGRDLGNWDHSVPFGCFSVLANVPVFNDICIENALQGAPAT